MEQPYLSDLIYLGRLLHKPLFEVLSWSQEEIIMQQAYDLSRNEKWLNKYKSDQLQQMSNADLYQHLKKQAKSK